MDNSTVPPKPLAKTIRQILILCEKVDLLIDEDDSQTLMCSEIHSLRSRVIRLCRTVFFDIEWSRRILDRIWKSCYYSVICRVRKAALSVEQKNWAEMLLSTYVKELCIFANDFPHLCAVSCLYIGDLRRYAWLICGTEKYRNLALLHYRKSAKLDEKNGIALNQLGLLVQEANPACALLYFLLADNAPVPFDGAYANVVRLLNQQEEQKEENPTISVLEQCFTYFRQSYFEELSIKWSEFFTLQLETRHAFHVALSINTVVLAAVTLLKKGKETELLSLSKLFFRISEVTTQNMKEWYGAEAEGVNLRRRRASSSDESVDVEIKEKQKHLIQSSSIEDDVVSEDDEGTGEKERTILNRRNRETKHRIETLLVALLHAATSLAPHVYNDIVPSALHCQYEDFCQQLIQFLNLLELNLEGKSENLWQLGGPTPWVLLPRFLQAFVHSPHTPVKFDEFFLYAPKNSTKEIKMKNMAKLWLAHDAEKEHIRTSLPLYVVPHEDVLLQRLEVMKKILKKDKLIVAIAEGTFRNLDMKKDKPEVRKALRWINAHISKGNGCLRIIPQSTPEKCAEKLLAQAPTTSTVFVTILTLMQVEADSVIKRPYLALFLRCVRGQVKCESEMLLLVNRERKAREEAINDEWLLDRQHWLSTQEAVQR
uniref:Bm12874 n=1 Tax=Setaria digitata TaxID=48799 RepID=A0A915Q7V8_9BILA